MLVSKQVEQKILNLVKFVHETIRIMKLCHLLLVYSYCAMVPQ